MYCAHGDSDAGGPGANDNASGVAVVLEMARAWSGAIADGDGGALAPALAFGIAEVNLAGIGEIRRDQHIEQGSAPDSLDREGPA